MLTVLKRIFKLFSLFLKIVFNLFILLLASIFCVAGFAMIWCTIDSAKQSVEASNWPSVTGTITNLSLREKSDSDGKTYGVEVDYRYSVMDRTYTSSRLAFGYASTTSRQPHQDIFNKLEPASSVKVRYNPQHPATSTLSSGIHSSIKFILAFAIVFLVMIFGIPLTTNKYPFVFIPWLVMIFGFIFMGWTLFQPDDILLKNMEVNLKVQGSKDG
jgi:hypothetical protein